MPVSAATVIAGLAITQAIAVVTKDEDIWDVSYWSSISAGGDLYNPVSNILKRGPRDKRQVLLTFDDGPHAQATSSILDVLKAERVPATFFVVGRRVDEAPGLVRRMIREGHEVANHTYDHLRLDSLPTSAVREELLDCEKAVQRATGRRMTMMRPPGMRFNQAVLDANRDFGYMLISWTAGVKDFAPSLSIGDLTFETAEALDCTRETIIERAVKQLKNGAILLLHDNEVTASALSEIIREARAQGFEFVSGSEFLRSMPAPIGWQANPVLDLSRSRTPRRIAAVAR